VTMLCVGMHTGTISTRAVYAFPRGAWERGQVNSGHVSFPCSAWECLSRIPAPALSMHAHAERGNEGKAYTDTHLSASLLLPSPRRKPGSSSGTELLAHLLDPGFHQDDDFI